MGPGTGLARKEDNSKAAFRVHRRFFPPAAVIAAGSAQGLTLELPKTQEGLAGSGFISGLDFVFQSFAF